LYNPVTDFGIRLPHRFYAAAKIIKHAIKKVDRNNLIFQ
jgi:hypothetical protein